MFSGGSSLRDTCNLYPNFKFRFLCSGCTIEKNGYKLLLCSCGAHPFIPVGTDDSRLQSSQFTFVVRMKALCWKYFVSSRYVLAHVKHTYDDISLRSNTITVEPGYNDIGLWNTSCIASDILWYQLIPRC